MSSRFFRPLLRTAALRQGNPTAFRTSRPVPIAPVALGLTSTLLHARTVASQVSGRPGSQTLEHAATNVKEELGNSASDLAKAIAGANVTQPITDSSADSFVSWSWFFLNGIYTDTYQ